MKPGSHLAHYRILSRLGAGGMGEVFLAEDTRLGRNVAIKVLSAEFTRHPDRVRRFQQEARAASALNHPNIVTIHDIGEASGTHYIATEYVEGETLRKRMSHGRMTLREVLEMGAQVAGALAAAHAAGIIHRDIKPDNLMVRPDGLVKVLDFGLAKLIEAVRTPSEEGETATMAQVNTDYGTVLGTPNYMSPEQTKGLKVDARSDLFSLGVVLYEMIAGQRPFEGETKSHILVAILEKEPQPLTRFVPESPEELQRIVGKALQKNREERYQVAKDLQIDLKQLRRRLERDSETALGLPHAAITPSTGAASVATPPPSKAPRKLPGRAIAVGAALLLLAGGAFLYLHRAPVLTEKDTIVLADFVNTTGDTVFDDTLKQGLAVQLAQSPFLNIYPDEQVRNAMKFMSRSPDERVTRQVALEICRRNGLKAMLAGSIAALGTHYAITLEAVSASAGDVIAREQEEAESKERVLHALGSAASKIRRQLGESLTSIQKYDTDIMQGTTPSLEALEAYTRSVLLNGRFDYRGGAEAGERALLLDPNFAIAYNSLAYCYLNMGGHSAEVDRCGRKAFALRDRASEMERLKITATYYNLVTNEVEPAIETVEHAIQIYPQEEFFHNVLAAICRTTGCLDRAVVEAQKAIRLKPNAGPSTNVLATAYLKLNRFSEARAVVEQARPHGLDGTNFRQVLFQVSFVEGDSAEIQKQLDWAGARPNDALHLDWQADAASFRGESRRMQDLGAASIALRQRQTLKEDAATAASRLALREAVLEQCRPALADARQSLSLAQPRFTFLANGLVLALCGEEKETQAVLTVADQTLPKSTFAQSVWLPAIRAALALRRNDSASAIRELQAALAYPSLAEAYPEYLRGQAFLAAKKPAEAAAEFQKILDHRGWAPVGPLYPLGHLGLARAAAMAGDAAKSRKVYQDLFALWKDADPDLPVLAAARREYAALPQ